MTPMADAEKTIVAMRLKHWRVAAVVFYLLGVILLLHIRAEAALVPWIIFGVLGRLAVRQLSSRDSGLRETYLIAYGLISFCGWLIAADNVRNFGVLFGGFHDDGEYYYNMLMILDQGRFRGVGIYEMLLAGIGYLCRLSGMKTIPLAFLLPFNFMLAAWAVLLAGKLAQMVTGRPIPLFLLLACTAGNFYFIDSQSRLYRDAMVMVLMLAAFVVFAGRRPWFGMLPAVAAGLLRGANGIVALCFGGVLCFRRLVGSTLHFWLLGVAGLTVAGVILRLAPFCFFAVVGDQARTGTYLSQLERQNTILQLLNRRKALARYFPPGSMARKAYKLGGVTGNALLLGGTVFYPFTFRGPSESIPVGNRYIPDKYLENGFFFFNLLKWGFTLSWLVVAPLLICGVAAACWKNELSSSLAMVYFLLVAGVTLISMQQRHVCAFVVLHPALAAIGYYLSKNDRFLIKLRKWLFIIVPTGIILWNILRYLVIK